MEIDQTLEMMVGKTIIQASNVKVGDKAILFVMADGSAYGFYHEQDCCEDVRVEDVCGEITDLIGAPLLCAEEVTNQDVKTVDPFTGKDCISCYDESQTWTFYKFATIKGSVTIRWLGESNGYYSEDVSITVWKSLEEIEPNFLSAALLAITAE